MIDENRVKEEHRSCDDEWYREHQEGLARVYPAKWIAVMNEWIICTGDSKEVVEKRAKEIAGEREYSLYFVEPYPTTLKMRKD